MATGQDSVMSKAELKKLLMAAKMQPINCAVGVTADRSAVILLSKMQAPKMVEANLKKSVPDVKDTRFGQASCEDGVTVIFRLNRASPGLERQLAVSLKGTGFTHAKIATDDSQG